MVALYIATDSFKVDVRARIKSITARTKWRATRANSSLDEPLLNEVLQKEKSIIWTTVTVKKVIGDKGSHINFQFGLRFSLRHTYLRGRYWECGRYLDNTRKQ